MKTDLFMHEVRQTSTVFGRKSDIDVVFHGSDAATDGKTIILPELVRGTDLSEETAAVMRGYTDHEAGHIRHSDMPRILRSYRRWMGEGKMLLRSLHNALEDIWLEQRVRAEYPGAERNLAATTTAVNRQFLDRLGSGEIAPDKARNLAYIAPVALTWAGRSGYGGPTCEECLTLLDEGDRERVRKWAAEVDDCKSSHDTIRLAERIYAELRAEAEAETETETEAGKEKVHGDGRGGEKGGEKGGDGEADETGGDGSESVDGSTGGDGPVKDAPGATSSSGGGKKSRGTKRPAPEGESDPSTAVAAEPEEVYEDFDVGGAMEAHLRDERLTGPDARSGYRAFSTRADAWHHRKLDTDKSKLLRRYDAGSYDRLLEGMQGDVNAIRRRLERALVSKQNRDWLRGQEEGRLDSRRFAAVVAGRTSVFKTRTERAEIDTALSLLVDLSGSMCHHGKAGVARDCVMAICEAVDRAGVAYEVIGFDNRRELPRGWKEQVERGVEAGTRYARWEPLDMVIFKAFEDRLFEAKGGIANIPDFAYGENTDGEALLMAYARLKARPERRKVLLTLSDGAPAAKSHDPAGLQKHLRTAIETLRADGCSCLGVGIMDGTVSHYYPEYVVVHSLRDLAGQALTLLGKQLLGERVGVDRSALMRTGS
jgi:cobalamin biosynthesis protein CobT